MHLLIIMMVILHFFTGGMLSLCPAHLTHTALASQNTGVGCWIPLL
jgi:hypothetical protein